MQTNYILSLKGGRLLCFYYVKDSGILFKAYEKNKWSRGRLVINNTREKFSVNLSTGGKIYLFCQDLEGSVVLCTYEEENDTWANKTILKNQSRSQYTIFFNAVITEKGMSLIYNTPSEDRSFYLMSQELNEKGQWSQAEKIDKFIPMYNNLYQVQHVTKEHLLIFYQSRVNENNLGYREFTPGKISKYNVFHTTGYQISEQSFLTTNNAIHVLYVVKSMFSSQLIYRKKDGEQFGNPLTVWEGPKIDTVNLFYVKDNLYLTFIFNDQLYFAVSENGGNTFTRAIKYRNKFCLHPVKAFYLSQEDQNEKEFFIRELYVDSENPCDIQMIPDLYEDFYNIFQPAQTPPPAPRREVSEEETSEFNEAIQKLQNQLVSAQKQLTEKDKQIIHFSNLLKNRNDEILQMDLEKKELARRIAALTEAETKVQVPELPDDTVIE